MIDDSFLTEMSGFLKKFRDHAPSVGGHSLTAELNRRLAEARAEERRAAINAEYAATRTKVEVAVERINNEYPALAAIILELCELADAADDATTAWSRRCFANESEGLPIVDTVMEHLELHNRWMTNGLTFANATRLLPVGKFEGHAIDFDSIALHHARYG